MASSKGKTSKTARASMPAKPGAKEISADIARVIPLGGGDYAYVLTASGLTRRTKAGSEEFHTLIRELAGSPAVRVTLNVLTDCAARFANPAWGKAAREIQGIEDDAGDDPTTEAAVTDDAVPAV